jgi:glucose/arabinose dehydrogenase
MRLGTISLGIIAATIAAAANLPAGFTEAQVATGLGNPTAMAFAPDGRLFVTEQAGRLRVIKNGALLATPFLSVTVSAVGERGLLGVALDPNFATNNHVYVYYTATTPAIHNRVSRFTANGDTALAGSETAILELNDLSGATNHNGGAMHFGPDGKLYIAVGENAHGANAQSLSNLLGKMLRVNADGSIPADNPFPAAMGNNRAIWALGLRNPFTFAFQTGTSRMFINDVGQNTWEEIDDGISGSNYGWPATEGQTSNPSYRSPIYAYGHGNGNFLGCAITGGTFYNPVVPQFPQNYVGVFFFADYCGGWINVLDHENGNVVTGFATGVDSPVDLQVGPDSGLYYLARGTGAVVRIDYTAAGSVNSRDYVQKAYVAYYGRPADPGGQSYWAARMDAEGGSLNAIITAFGNSDEFNRRYGGLSNSQLITRIYQQTLGRDPEQSGLNYYVEELQAGRRTLQTITLDVLNGATTAPDSTVVANKLDVAAYYTGKVAAGCPYGTELDGVETLLDVTALSASENAAKAAIDAWCGP